MNKQHLHFALHYTDKANNLIATITNTDESWHKRKSISHQRLEELDICFTDEIMRFPDRGFPHLHNAGKVLSVYWKNAR